MSADIRGSIEKALAPFRRYLRSVINAAVVKAIDDSTKRQLLQVAMLESELLDGVDHVQPYGFASVPLPGAEGVLVALGGPGGRRVLLNAGMVEERLKNLAEGDVAVYRVGGSMLLFRKDKKTALVSDELKLGSEAAARELAGKGHAVEITITPANVATMAMANGGGPVVAAAPVTIQGTITAGFPKLLGAD